MSFGRCTKKSLQSLSTTCIGFTWTSSRDVELLKAAIQAELNVIYLLPESGGRLPDGSRDVEEDEEDDTEKNQS
eukprot:Skav234417  [mRNA]  locus=scaffold4957:3252:8032:+ [translate_table: standard]